MKGLNGRVWLHLPSRLRIMGENYFSGTEKKGLISTTCRWWWLKTICNENWRATIILWKEKWTAIVMKSVLGKKKKGWKFVYGGGVGETKTFRRGIKRDFLWTWRIIECWKFLNVLWLQNSEKRSRRGHQKTDFWSFPNAFFSVLMCTVVWPSQNSLLLNP